MRCTAPHRSDRRRSAAISVALRSRSSRPRAAARRRRPAGSVWCSRSAATGRAGSRPGDRADACRRAGAAACAARWPGRTRRRAAGRGEQRAAGVKERAVQRDAQVPTSQPGQLAEGAPQVARHAVQPARCSDDARADRCIEAGADARDERHALPVGRQFAGVDGHAGRDECVLQCLHPVHRKQAGRTRRVVAAAERNQRERVTAFQRCGEQVVHGAVAADHDDARGGRQRAQALLGLADAARHHQHHRRCVVAQPLEQRLAQRCGSPAGGARVQQDHGRRHAKDWTRRPRAAESGLSAGAGRGARRRRGYSRPQEVE